MSDANNSNNDSNEDFDNHTTDDSSGESGPSRALCRTCGGIGVIYSPKLGMRGGAPATVHNHETCPQCHGERFLRSLEPPV